MNEPRIDFSYTVYWTKQARQWPPERQAEILAAVQASLRQPDFQLNAYARRYTVPELDEQTHAGASLAALEKVLIAFQVD
ncbi:MAG: hypothetical protein JNL09_04820 [Anaerolineales bacterium]|nr:hypothetical protein [Anaerolineales bacterium]